ncbi:MAG: hypothetical protein IJF54_00210 [Clostridia bacterium]|nr:hypothetical protein [Clostridia bacterium]
MNNNQLNDLINMASSKLNSSPESIKKAVNTAGMDNMLKNMKQQDIDKLQKILSNKEETQRLLSTPQAQALLKMLGGNK